MAITENRVNMEEIIYGELAQSEEIRLLKDMVLKGKSQSELTLEQGVTPAA